VIKKKIGLFVMLFLVATSSYAGKLKTAKSFLPELEKSAKQVESQIDQVNAYLNSINQTGKFLKTDFWGTAPAWYLNPSHSGVTNHYPFHKILDSSLSRAKRDELFKRSIKNISLAPLKVDTWRVKLDFNYEFLFDREHNKYSSAEAVKSELLTNRVPEARINEALKYYYTFYVEVENLYLNLLIPKLDGLYKGVLFDQSAVKSPKFRAIFGESLVDVKKHPEIIKANLEAFKIGTLHSVLRLKSLDKLKEKYKNGELNGDAFMIFVNLARYSFQVGNNMTESQKTSQIFDFSELLKAKTKSGDATAIIYDAKGSDTASIFGRNDTAVKVYQDAEQDLKYKGAVFFDESTGKGLWQTALWQSRSDLEQLKAESDKANETLKTATTTYLDMALREAILKFAPEEQGKQSADDF